MDPIVRPVLLSELSLLDEHCHRHRAESGNGDLHFMPYATDDADALTGLDVDAMARPVTETGWQRWFVAFVDGAVIGHSMLKGDDLKAGLHRCEFGIGIERSHRGRGLGRQLASHATEFAQAVESLDWVDLMVFAHNTAARSLYLSVGFVESATIHDRFRIDREPIDDVLMSRNVATDHRRRTS